VTIVREKHQKTTHKKTEKKKKNQNTQKKQRQPVAQGAWDGQNEK